MSDDSSNALDSPTSVALPTRSFVVEEKDGNLLLRKPGPHGRTINRAIWAGSRLIWVVAAALPLAGIVPVPRDGTYAMVAAICSIVILFTNIGVIANVPSTGPVVSAVQDTLWIGYLPDEAGYRGTGPRRPAIRVDDVAIMPGRLDRVTVGFIEPEEHASRNPRVFTVNLVMVDGVVTVDEFNDEMLARQMAAGLASKLCVSYEPSELPWYNFQSLGRKTTLMLVAAMMVNTFGAGMVLVQGMETASFSPWRWEGAVAASLLLDTAIRRLIIASLVRPGVERIARDAFKIAPSLAKAGPA